MVFGISHRAHQENAELRLAMHRADEAARRTDKPPETVGVLDRPTFGLGDVVQLKSGGFAMTVVSKGCCGTVDVAWCCHSSGDIREECFERDCLQHFNANQAAGGDVPF